MQDSGGAYWNQFKKSDAIVIPPNSNLVEINNKLNPAGLKQAQLDVQLSSTSTASAAIVDATPSPLPQFLQCLCLPFIGAHAELTVAPKKGLRAA